MRTVTGLTGAGRRFVIPMFMMRRQAEPPGYEILMDVRLESEAGQEQVIAEGDSAYGRWAFYAVEPETGKVGFTREGRTYHFDYTLPVGEWVRLRLVGISGRTTLYVDGKEVDSLGSDEPFEEHATFAFPLQRVGSRTGQFDGELELQVVMSAGGVVSVWHRERLVLER